jgi:hypothetical protein
MTLKNFRGQALAAILAIASLLIDSAVASDVVTSKLQIHIPQNLKVVGGYDHREALFGVPPYGGAIIENVIFADDPMCSQEFDMKGGYPQNKDENGNVLPWKTPFILMIDRGGCTFVQKVRNAQRAGAAAVIIADEVCRCKFESTCHTDPGLDCEEREPVMADDGSGSDISIPSFLMFKQDADPVKAALTQNNPVRMELRWSLPNPTDTVNYDLWTTPSDRISEEFQLDFKEAALAMGGKAKFSPHMYLYDGYSSGCVSLQGENLCYNLCTNNGRYCATDPDNDLDAGVSGANVVVESLRRMCIWKIHGKDGVGKEWWDYVDNFITLCGMKFFTDDKCISDAMTNALVDTNEVFKCMDDSGGTEDDKGNDLLEQEITSKDASGIVILPVSHVNGASVRGELSFPTMFKAVCSGFKDGTQPDICTKCAQCHDEKLCVERGYCTAPPGAASQQTTQQSVSKITFGLTIVAVVLAFATLAFAGYKYHQRRMRSQIRGILAEYMPIDKEGNLHDTALDVDDAEFS